MTARRWRCLSWFFTAILLLLPTREASAILAVTLSYNGGNGVDVFGVAPYGPPTDNGGPTYIGNNFTHFNDILTSPGLGSLGGYQTAVPVIANNIASYGPAALPLTAFQVGGGNGAGNFGSGSIANLGTGVGFSLADSGAGGGSASYELASGITSYTVGGLGIPGGATFGAYLAIAGSVPLVGNADVAALRVHVTDTAGVFGAGGSDLPQIVLAISRNGMGTGIGNYNIVAIAGQGGGNAALILDNGTTGSFRALGVDNLALAGGLPGGDVLTVDYTLTAYSDPASFSSFDPIGANDLLSLTGPLPTFSLVSSADAPVPEPSSLAMMGAGMLGVLGYVVRKRRARTVA